MVFTSWKVHTKYSTVYHSALSALTGAPLQKKFEEIQLQLLRMKKIYINSQRKRIFCNEIKYQKGA